MFEPVFIQIFVRIFANRQRAVFLQCCPQMQDEKMGMA